MNTDWDQLDACKEALRENMALVRERDDEIERLRDELSDAKIKLENEKLGAEMIYQENDRVMHDCQNFLNEIERLCAENAALKDRLEIEPDIPEWDGIACRNETIRIQDELIDGLTSGIPLLVETNKRLMDVTDRLCTALEAFTHPNVKALLEHAINVSMIVGAKGPEYVSWVEREEGPEK